MTCWTLIRRSLRFHARSHLGVVLGAAIGSAALTGALIVGDSVRESLRERALQRLANTYYALAPADRFFSPEILDKSHVFGLYGYFFTNNTFTNLQFQDWPLHLSSSH